jgi:hypothetical protein
MVEGRRGLAVGADSVGHDGGMRQWGSDSEDQ